MEQFSNDEENIIQLKQRRYFISSFVKNISNGYTLRILYVSILSLRLKIEMVQEGIPNHKGREA
jgi:hypothetical protein